MWIWLGDNASSAPQGQRDGIFKEISFLTSMDPVDDSIFPRSLLLFTKEEWDQLGNEFCQNGFEVFDLHPLWGDLQLETGVGGIGVEDSLLNPHVPYQPGGNGDQASDQINSHIPIDGSTFTSCLLMFAKESDQLGGVRAFDLHPQGPDNQLEAAAEDDGIEGPRLDPDVPHYPGERGHQVSSQISQEPDHADEELVLQGSDHPGENEVGQLRTQAVGTNALGPEYPGKDGEGGNSFPQSLEHATSVSDAPEASSNYNKQCVRPPVAPHSTQHCGRPRDTRGLPEGWTTEVKVRREGKSRGHKDKSYIETSTGKRC